MLLFIALSPVMMLGSFIDQRARHRRQRREEAERFSAGLDSLRSDLMTRSTSELAGRLVEAPGTSEVVSAARSRTPLLWTRLPEHASFLALRLGTGTLESRTSVQLPGRQLDGGDEWDRLSALVEEFRTIGDVNVVIPPILNPFAGEGAKVVVPLTVVQATTDPLGNHELIASNDVRNWSALGDVLKGLRQ